VARATGGARHDRPERQAVGDAHHTGIVLEVQIVQGDDRSTAPTQRQRMLEVGELGLQPA
jgi:hypothetical protein